MQIPVDDTLPMGGCERRADLLHPAKSHGRADAPRRQPGREVLVHEPHDQVGGIGFPPPVVEGNDVRVLQARDPARVRIEPADELLVVRDRRAQDLDRHVALGLRLYRAMHNGDRPRSDDGNGAIPPQRSAAQLERRILLEDLALEGLDGRGGIQAEFRVERVPQPVIGVQGLCLATGPVQRKHQLAVQALAKRVLGRQALELGDEVSMLAEGQLRLDAILGRGEAQLG
jgi:hypothetical protein